MAWYLVAAAAPSASACASLLVVVARMAISKRTSGLAWPQRKRVLCLPLTTRGKRTVALAAECGQRWGRKRCSMENGLTYDLLPERHELESIIVGNERACRHDGAYAS